ncbi:unnamed protein product [Strongylus vulgaris]|uniref:Uncharacterized protein n=1 Tax=Strongylus vulgaris TaxID=40348 RepID=A0A3P7JIM8_STRVU|nr:unnamed protein product [Strongylus vulgaris]
MRRTRDAKVRNPFLTPKRRFPLKLYRFNPLLDELPQP